jgi:hypothetical protein
VTTSLGEIDLHCEDATPESLHELRVQDSHNDKRGQQSVECILGKHIHAVGRLGNQCCHGGSHNLDVESIRTRRSEQSSGRKCPDGSERMAKPSLLRACVRDAQQIGGDGSEASALSDDKSGRREVVRRNVGVVCIVGAGGSGRSAEGGGNKGGGLQRTGGRQGMGDGHGGEERQGERSGKDGVDGRGWTASEDGVDGGDGPRGEAVVVGVVVGTEAEEVEGGAGEGHVGGKAASGAGDPQRLG